MTGPRQPAAAPRRAGRTWGLVLSVLGVVATLVALVVTLFAPNAMVVLVLVLAAACLLIPGEQLRRGVMMVNPNPPATALPTASVISRFRPLSLRWHAIWAALGLLVCLVLVLVPALESLLGRVIPPFGYALDFAWNWLIIGWFGWAIEAAALASLYKKAHYLKVTGRAGDRIGRGAPRAALWRFITYRWRLDLWVAGVGGAAFGLGLVTPALADPRIPGDVASALGFSGLMLVVGAGVFAAGLWMSSNYWKAGRPLGSGESYS
ncbi:hypothetical protein GCM10022286_17200 [Gryllotalpicola daejeonensis]|uniref:Uncharacterized protein n=1 Tax=Gryllotalpicola daejeonensis TaxID=993087 RepID=A0ABP7ZJT9_9MICO